MITNLIIELVLTLSLAYTIVALIKQSKYVDGLSRRIKAIEQAIKQLATDTKKNNGVELCNWFTIANQAINKAFDVENRQKISDELLELIVKSLKNEELEKKLEELKNGNQINN